MSTNHLTPLQALEKLKSYCAWQERCHSEVKQKLFSYGVYGDDADDVIATLIVENYLNEERFAIQYVGGKLRMKKWGKYKILAGLKEKRVSEPIIKIAMKTMDLELYYQNLVETIEKKAELLKSKKGLDLQFSLQRYAAQKGYENDLIADVIKEKLGKI